MRSTSSRSRTFSLSASFCSSSCAACAAIWSCEARSACSCAWRSVMSMMAAIQRSTNPLSSRTAMPLTRTQA
jgi:hypothetical protein